MTCEAEERALAFIREQRLDAKRQLQQEKVKAESALLRSNASMYDWSAVRRATRLVKCWGRRYAQAEDALAGCREKEERQRTSK